MLWLNSGVVMAWDDMIRSINTANKILGKELTERELPRDYVELRRLLKETWRQVRAR